MENRLRNHRKQPKHGTDNCDRGGGGGDDDDDDDDDDDRRDVSENQQTKALTPCNQSAARGAAAEATDCRAQRIQFA